MQDTDIPVETVLKVLREQKQADKDRRMALLGIVVSVALGFVALADGLPIVPPIA